MRSFQDVLSDAIEDVTLHGFDTVERIERWKRELRQAAEASLISAASLEQELRDALAKIYQRMVEQHGIFKYHPGVERFTLEKIKPSLRSELDRRIVASASLIKLNREEAISSTLRRFEGWSTSIQPGGVPAEKRVETKKNIRKSLKSLPFEERRVIIDQGHKLVSAISEIMASDGGAIAGRWRSNYRQPGYNYRKDHKERDDIIYLIRDSWAHRAGLVKRNKDGYYDDIDAPGTAVFCRCYMIWIYSLRELPDDMLTAKGKEALAAAREKLAVMRATARSDAMRQDVAVTQRAANYTPWWPTKITRCQRCAMFVPGIDPRHNGCSAVQGDIALHGHCRLFAIGTARNDDAGVEPQPAVGYEAMRRRLARLKREAECR